MARKGGSRQEAVMSKVLVLPGDGIGPEIVKEAVKVLNVAKQ